MSSWIESVPETRQKQVDVSHLLHLVDKDRNVRQELCWIVIVKNVHIHSLSSAVCESFSVVLLVDELADTRKNHGTRKDGFQVASRHL